LQHRAEENDAKHPDETDLFLHVATAHGSNRYAQRYLADELVEPPWIQRVLRMSRLTWGRSATCRIRRRITVSVGPPVDNHILTIKM
jgi:hypothetical protein